MEKSVDNANSISSSLHTYQEQQTLYKNQTNNKDYDTSTINIQINSQSMKEGSTNKILKPKRHSSTQSQQKYKQRINAKDKLNTQTLLLAQALLYNPSICNIVCKDMQIKTQQSTSRHNFSDQKSSLLRTYQNNSQMNLIKQLKSTRPKLHNKQSSSFLYSGSQQISPSKSSTLMPNLQIYKQQSEKHPLINEFKQKDLQSISELKYKNLIQSRPKSQMSQSRRNFTKSQTAQTRLNEDISTMIMTESQSRFNNNKNHHGSSVVDDYNGQTHTKYLYNNSNLTSQRDIRSFYNPPNIYDFQNQQMNHQQTISSFKISRPTTAQSNMKNYDYLHKQATIINQQPYQKMSNIKDNENYIEVLQEDQSQKQNHEQSSQGNNLNHSINDGPNEISQFQRINLLSLQQQRPKSANITHQRFNKSQTQLFNNKGSKQQSFNQNSDFSCQPNINSQSSQISLSYSKPHRLIMPKLQRPEIPSSQALFNFQNGRHSQSVMLPEDQNEQNLNYDMPIININSNTNNQVVQPIQNDDIKYLYDPNSQTNTISKVAVDSNNNLDQVKVDRSIQYSSRPQTPQKQQEINQQQTPFQMLTQQIDNALELKPQLIQQNKNNFIPSQYSHSPNQNQYSKSYTLAQNQHSNQYSPSKLINRLQETVPQQQQEVFFNLGNLQQQQKQPNFANTLTYTNNQNQLLSSTQSTFSNMNNKYLPNSKKYTQLSRRLDKMRDLVEDIKYQDYLKRVEILNQKKAYLSTYRFVLQKEEKQILIKEIEEREHAIEIDEKQMFVN